MVGTGPKSFKSLSEQILRRFGRHSDQLSVIQLRWKGLVGHPMAAHAEPTNYEGGRLTVTADGPAWASRVRQQASGLARALRADPALRTMRDIRVCIQPTKPLVAPTMTRARRPSRLSPKAARLLQSVATSVSDPQLRAALERLSAINDTET